MGNRVTLHSQTAPHATTARHSVPVLSTTSKDHGHLFLSVSLQYCLLSAILEAFFLKMAREVVLHALSVGLLFFLHSELYCSTAPLSVVSVMWRSVSTVSVGRLCVVGGVVGGAAACHGWRVISVKWCFWGWSCAGLSGADTRWHGDRGTEAP